MTKNEAASVAPGLTRFAPSSKHEDGMMPMSDGDYVLLADVLAQAAPPAAIRCACCGYLVTQSEHKGCLRAAAPPAAPVQDERQCTCGSGPGGGHSRTCQMFDESMMRYDPFGLAAQQDEREARAFEDWLARVCPSGDCEAVQRQWEESSDYADLHDDQQAQADAVAVAAFERWLCSEMPAGTVIGDPKWWAPRILRAALSRDMENDNG